FSWSSTIRTARARTSGENLFVVLLVIAPSSQELGPPTNPARFNTAFKVLAGPLAGMWSIARRRSTWWGLRSVEDGGGPSR
ncbi:hypothetical protein, partial [Sphingomonas koreensis]|uniref:hypothetical protein n=1 Tax=Sphingomonas koreensis TaxID=93064 RepID=UPI001002F1E8